MRDFWSIQFISKAPGIYCLLGFSHRGLWPAYVGIGTNIQTRVSQHLEYRNSSVSTGASAVSLDPSLIGGCRWWTDPSFQDPVRLLAAELIAFEHLQPALRSRGGINRAALDLQRDPAFCAWVSDLLTQQTSMVEFPGISHLGKQVRALEKKIEILEAKLAELAQNR